MAEGYICVPYLNASHQSRAAVETQIDLGEACLGCAKASRLTKRDSSREDEGVLPFSNLALQPIPRHTPCLPFYGGVSSVDSLVQGRKSPTFDEERGALRGVGRIDSLRM